MRSEDKKYVWWGLLGIGVAAFFYFLSAKNQKTQANTVTVPYLVPSTMSNGSSPSADTSLNSQPNIIGNSPANPFPNGTNPYGVNPNTFEVPGTWNWTPNLTITNPVPFTGGNVQTGFFSTTNATLPNGISQQQVPTHV
jgi:hypothetical protein